MGRRLKRPFACEALGSRRLLATVFWDGGAGTNSWHDAANWSGDQLPGAADDVVINVAGSALVIRHTQNVVTAVKSIKNFEPLVVWGGTIETSGVWQQNAAISLNGGAIGGAGNFYLNAPMAWVGGSMAGAGRSIVQAGRELKIAGTVTLARDLFVDGALKWNSGDIRFEDASLVVRPSGIMHLLGSGTAVDVSGTNLLGVNGVLGRNALPSGTGASVVCDIEVPLKGTGRVAMLSETLQLAIATIAEIQMSGGTLLVGETLTVNGFLGWTGGWLSGSSIVGPPTGLLRIAPGATASVGATSLNLRIGTLENHGTVNWAGGSLISTSVVENKGTWHVYGDAGLLLAGPTGFTNHGVFVLHANLAVTSGSFARFVNAASGTVRVMDFCTLSLASGGSSAGTIVGEAGSWIWFQTRPYVLTGDLEGFGHVRAESLNWAGGSIVGPGAFFTLPTAPGQHALTISGPAPKALGMHLFNHVSVLWSGGPLELRGVSIRNEVDGEFWVSSAGPLTASGETSFTNLGTLNKSGPLAVSWAASGLAFSNPGKLVIKGGSFALAGSSVHQISGSTLTGGRWLVAHGSTLDLVGATILTNLATVRILDPGSTFDAIASLTTNNGTFDVAGTGGGVFSIQPSGGTFTNNGVLSIGAGATLAVQGGLTLGASSRLFIDLATPSQFGRLDVSGLAAVGGEVTARFGFIATSGQVFQFLTAGTRTGVFSQVLEVGLPNSLTVVAAYLPGAVRFSVP